MVISHVLKIAFLTFYFIYNLLGSVSGNDAFVGSINSFSLNLFEQINQLKPKENVVLSPFSLAMAMGMLQQGTLGETEKDIGATLFQGLKKEDVARQFRQLKQVQRSFSGMFWGLIYVTTVPV